MPKEAPRKLEMDDRKEDDNIILKVDMHCQGCKERVRKSLIGIQGLEKIDIDMNAQRVTVKGKVDAKTLLETVRKKSGRRTEIIFPAQLSQEGGRGNKEKKTEEDVAIDSIIKTIDSITALFLNQRDVTVVLRVKMHCGGCAKQVQKALQKMEGVYDVKVDFEGEKVTVKGKNIDPMEVCERVRKKTGKHAALISSQKKEEKKEGESEKKESKKGDTEKTKEENSEKKESKKGDTEKTENKKEENSEKKESKKGDTEKTVNKKEENSEKKESKKGDTEKKDNKKEENSQKKEEKQNSQKKVEKEKQEDSQKKAEKEKKVEEKKVEGQEKSTQKAEEDEKKEEGKGDEQNRKSEVKKSQHSPAMAVPEYAYPPQLFSDENPNACIIM